MDLFFWILFGIISGVFAYFLESDDNAKNMIGMVLLSVLGAALGGLLGSILFGEASSGFNTPSFIVASIGILIVLWMNKIARMKT